MFNRQEAILAAISEKDAHLALLEMNGPGPKKPKVMEEIGRLNKEKDQLQIQLRDVVSGRELGGSGGMWAAVRLRASDPCAFRAPPGRSRKRDRWRQRTYTRCVSDSSNARNFNKSR